MSLSKILFSFQGRVPRSIYWYLFLTNVVVGIIAGVLDAVVGASSQTSYGSSSSSVVFSTIATLIMLVPGLAVSVKRAHDRDHSGWFILIGLIPFIGAVWLLIELGFLPGTPGTNKYGEAPSGRVILQTA